MENRYYLGIDFGTSNTSLAYVVDNPLDSSPRFPQVGEIKVAMDEESALASTRIPTAVAYEKNGKKAPQRLLGWELWRRLSGLRSVRRSARKNKVPLMRRTDRSPLSRRHNSQP